MKHENFNVFSGFLLQEIGKLDSRFYDFPVTLACLDGNLVTSCLLLAAISPFMREMLVDQGTDFLVNLIDFDILLEDIQMFLDVVIGFKKLENSSTESLKKVSKLFNIESMMGELKNAREDKNQEFEGLFSIEIPEIVINRTEMEEIDLNQKGIVFSCSHCHFTSNTLSDVSDHMESSHMSETENFASTNVNAGFGDQLLDNNKVKECDKDDVFHTKLKHGNTTTEEVSTNMKHVHLENQDIEVKDRVKEECLEAGHSSKVNQKKGQQSIIECEECGNKFSSIYTLKRHMTTHNKVKAFHCKLCSKSFTQKVVLKEHILMHAGEKRFSCNMCDKSFQQKNHLKYHMLSAHGIGNRHTCEDCGKVFIFRHQLTSHISKVHGDLTNGCFSCQECSDRVFMTKTKYNIHMETFHSKKNINKLCRPNKI